jgi:hypothetical protein
LLVWRSSVAERSAVRYRTSTCRPWRWIVGNCE